MTDGIQTLELARIYESQGYHQDAHDIYLFLNQTNPSTEIAAGLSRMKKRLAYADAGESISESSETDEITSLLNIIEPELAEEEKGISDESFVRQKEAVSSLIDQWMSLIALQEQVRKSFRVFDE